MKKLGSFTFPKQDPKKKMNHVSNSLIPVDISILYKKRQVSLIKRNKYGATF